MASTLLFVVYKVLLQRRNWLVLINESLWSSTFMCSSRIRNPGNGTIVVKYDLVISRYTQMGYDQKRRIVLSLIIEQSLHDAEIMI